MKIDKKSVQVDLISKRIDNLKQINSSGLRAYGKILGMDFFLWLNPNLFELENTLNSFPEPIIWFGNKHDIIELTKQDSPWHKKTFLLCSYDEAGLSFPNSVLDNVKNVLGCKKIQDALDLIPSLSKKQSCFIFTISGDYFNQYYKTISEFIEKYKV